MYNYKFGIEINVLDFIIKKVMKKIIVIDFFIVNFSIF